MTVLVALAFTTALVLTYALWGRAWLKSKPWSERFFTAIEPYELFLFKKSETILVARLKMLTGALLTLQTQVGSIDLTPIMPFVPEKYQPYVNFAINLAPLVLSAIGFMDEKLRNETTKPIELVAVQERAMPQAVADAIAVADYAKASAVATVTDAKVV